MHVQMIFEIRLTSLRQLNQQTQVTSQVLGGINEGFNWRTYVPQEVKDMSTEHTVLEDSNFKPMGAVGAAALTLTKVILACKSLAPLKLFWTNTYARGNVLVKSILIRRDNQRSNTVYIIFCSRDELLFRTSYTLYDDNEDKTSKTYRHLTNGYELVFLLLQGWSSMKGGSCVQLRLFLQLIRQQNWDIGFKTYVRRLWK